jgi:hypothetical protein
VHDFDVLAAEFEHQVEIFAGVAEIGDQAVNRRVEAQEQHLPVTFEARHRLQAQGVAVESRRVGVVTRDRGQMSFEVEGPGVIKAAQQPGRAGALAADDIPAMRAAVDERVRRSAAVAHQDDRAAPNLAGDEVTRVGDLHSWPA